MAGRENNQITKEDAARIQATQAKGGGDMGKGGFAARAQAAADRHAHEASKGGAGNSSSNNSSSNGKSGGGGGGQVNSDNGHGGGRRR